MCVCVCMFRDSVVRIHARRPWGLHVIVHDIFSEHTVTTGSSDLAKERGFIYEPINGRADTTSRGQWLSEHPRCYHGHSRDGGDGASDSRQRGSQSAFGRFGLSEVGLIFFVQP